MKWLVNSFFLVIRLLKSIFFHLSSYSCTNYRYTPVNLNFAPLRYTMVLSGAYCRWSAVFLHQSHRSIPFSAYRCRLHTSHLLVAVQRTRRFLRPYVRSGRRCIPNDPRFCLSVSWVRIPWYPSIIYQEFPLYVFRRSAVLPHYDRSLRG